MTLGGRVLALGVTLFLAIAAPSASAAVGQLDPGFDGDGVKFTAMNGTDQQSIARGVAIAPDGTTVAAGFSDQGSDQDVALAHFGASGNFLGANLIDIGGFALANDVVRQPDGKLVLAGYGTTGGDTILAVLRRTALGAPDPTFSDADGIRLDDIGSNSNSEAHALALYADGRILVGGSVQDGGVFKYFLARYLANGAPDTSFGGGDGLVIHIFAAPATITQVSLRDVAIDSQQRILATGWVVDGGVTRMFLSRYTTAGLLDTGGFSTGTTAGYDIRNIGSASAPTLGLGLALQSGDRPIVGGHTTISGETKGFVARYNSAGGPDGTWNNSSGLTVGAAVFQLAGGAGVKETEVNDVAVQPSGDVVAGGATTQGLVTRFFAARFEGAASDVMQGQFDLDWNGSGVTIQGAGNGSFANGNALALGFGRAVVAGNVINGGLEQFGLVAVQDTLPPTADFDWNPDTPKAGASVAFTSHTSGGFSTDVDGQVVAYEWDLDGDGTYETPTGSSTQVNHSFPTPGEKTVGLRVTDDDGAQDTVTHTITVVTNQPPVAGFTWSAEPKTFKSVDFTPAGSSDPDGHIVAYAWDFDGDDKFTVADKFDQPQPYTFKTPGPHRVQLRVTDDGGLSRIAERFVTVAKDCDENTTVKVGGVVPVAPCLSTFGSGSGKVYAAAPGQSVRINGLDVKPAKGERVAFQPSTNGVGTVNKEVTAATTTPVNFTLAGADDDETADLGLGKQTLQWTVPKGGELPFSPPSINAPKFPLPVASIGNFKPKADGSMAFTLYLKLPNPIDNVSGEAVVSTSNGSGFKLDELHVKAHNVPIFTINVTDLSVDWIREPSQFDGSLGVDFPGQPGYAAPHLLGEVHFVKSKLTKVYAELQNLNVQMFPNVFLQDVGAGLETEPLLKLLGSARVSVGPELVGGLPPAVEVDGDFSLTLGGGWPYSFSVDQATASTLGIPLATAHATVWSNGDADFGGSLSFSAFPYSFTASVSGGFGGSWFYVFGKGEGCAGFDIVGHICIGASGIVSNIGFAACGIVSPPIVPDFAAGFGIYWGGGFRIFGGCDLSNWDPTAASASSPTAVKSVNVANGTDAVAFRATGPNGPPQVHVTGPGTDFITPANPFESVKTDRIWVIQDTTQNQTNILVLKPGAGEWKLDPVGASQVTKVERAHDLPEPKVTAKVGGKGHARTLTYSVKPIPGQTVTLVEEGTGAMQKLTSQKSKASGAATRKRMAFRPTDGRGGKRRIVAYVAQDRLPRERIVVTSYKAPKPLLPSKPRKLRVKRRRTKLAISWRRGGGLRASRYEVVVRFASGRVQRFLTKRRSLRLGGVAPTDRPRVTVRGLRTDGRKSKPAKARLRRAKRGKALNVGGGRGRQGA